MFIYIIFFSNNFCLKLIRYPIPDARSYLYLFDEIQSQHPIDTDKYMFIVKKKIVGLIFYKIRL